MDTGLYEPGGLRQLERALDQAGLRLEHVRLLVCTHAHSDHYGLAGPIVAAAGCELWMHPNHSHMSTGGGGSRARLRAAPRGGAPEWGAGRFARPLPGRARRAGASGSRRSSCRTATCCPGSRSTPTWAASRCTRRPATRRRTWSFTSPSAACSCPGTICSAACRSSTTTAGRRTPPASSSGASTWSADLDVQLVPAGHGRPVRDAPALVAANRREVERQLGVVRAALAAGPRTPFEIVPCWWARTPRAGWR